MKSCSRCTTHSRKKGYNPVNQLVGYILSEDPTYITTYKGGAFPHPKSGP